MKSTFADIILPVPLPRLFTYHIDREIREEVETGKRVVVSFGKKKLYSGLVESIHHQPPADYETKPILTILDDTPIVTQRQIDFWKWLAAYYQCTVGEVYKAALPSGLKLESESHIIPSEDFQAEAPLNKNEGWILDFIRTQKKCTIEDINQAGDLKNALPAVKRLLDKGAISIVEHLKESYKPKVEKLLVLHPGVRNESALEDALKRLNRAPKQADCLLAFLNLVGSVKSAYNGDPVKRNELLEDPKLSSNALAELIKKNILQSQDMEVGRLSREADAALALKTLTPPQRQAWNDIKSSFEIHPVTLLHGVTSSGKTEIYIHLIEEALNQGQQVLYLLPEIALTTQITTRLKKHFGNKLGIFHSRFSDAERVEVWNSLLIKNEYQVILGVRSSIFLPFTNLGLVIIDEEHETSYKQFDPAPRYHARDAAIVLANMHKAKTLLGTGTPSIETYYNCQEKKYGLVELSERYQGIKMPVILPVNTREAYRKKQMQSHFHPELIEEMSEALKNNEQVILFQNRRGFAPFLECQLCAWVPKCDHCDVSLTYHKHLNQLVCHYCSHTIILPKTCPACGSGAIQTKGFGTEKIEEEIQLIFPDASIARMDLDTTRSRKAYERIIGDFEQKKVQILIGTQMISKGLDFDDVSVVGILNADTLLNYPDFRAFEKSYQMMAQVSGRAGRKNKQGKVILQTANPEHQVIRDVINNNFLHNYEVQMEERELFKYPPFYRLINLTIKHKDKQKCNKAAFLLARQLKQLLGDRVLGPQAPPVSRLFNQFINKVLIKIEKDASSAKVKGLIQNAIKDVQSNQELRYVVFQVDVDPM
jgi:primosomal protein N' (replication factor Y)